VDAFPDDEFEGRIDRVEPQGRLNSGSSIIQFDVHVWITDPKQQKLPLGAQAQVEFTVESATNALLVPAEAVKSHDGQRGVWIKVPPASGSQDEFGKRFVPCRFGISDSEKTEVVGVGGGGSLPEGTEVYTKLPQEVATSGD
jgi:multidrug efflux pump subunit AcrA (membrane-fusion protein)